MAETEAAEMEKFRDWVDSFATRQDAANALKRHVNYVYMILSGQRSMNDKLRAAWRRATTPETE